MQLGKHQPELLDMSLQKNQATTDAQSIADIQGQKLAHLREKWNPCGNILSQPWRVAISASSENCLWIVSQPW